MSHRSTAALLVMLALTACSESQTEMAAPAPAQATTNVPPADAAPAVVAGMPILRAVRAGKHEGLERLVFEFDGAALPAWKVDYVERPIRDCGSGDTVPVAGEALLQVRFSGAHAHTEAGEGTSGPRRRNFEQALLRELVRTCDFEGEVTWVAGLAGANAYTTRVLAAPSRLVIDIAR